MYYKHYNEFCKLLNVEKNVYIMGVFVDITKRACHMIITFFLHMCFRNNFIITLCLSQILLSPTYFSCGSFSLYFMCLFISPDWKYNKYETEADSPHPLLMWTMLIYNRAVLPLRGGVGEANSWFDGKSALILRELGVQT